MHKLTKIEKQTILSATKDKDYCTIAHGRTMNSLVKKNFAKWSDGFGYKFGVLIELTDIGKELQSKLKDKKL